MDPRRHAWFEELPEDWRDVANNLRVMLLEASPRMTESRKYGIPFYTHVRWMCYISLQKDHLVLAFLQGRELGDVHGLLARTDHKLVRHHLLPRVMRPTELDLLRDLIAEAVLLNEAPRPQQRVRRR